MKIKEKLIYLKILIKKKINKKIQTHYFIININSSESVVMQKFEDLYLTDYCSGAIIIINKFNVTKKEELIQIVRYLTKKKKKIEIVEEERMLNSDDIRRLYNINNKIILNNAYIEKRVMRARNEILECDITTYLQILEKVQYFVQICKEKFKTEEEQIIFTIVQLSNYVRYGKIYEINPCLVNAFILRTGVCIDFAIAFWKIIDELGIECKMITGIADEKKEEQLIDVNHAWNQVKINDNWYNVEITWFNTLRNLDMILVDDKTFTKDGMHKVVHLSSNETCTSIYDRQKLKELITEFEQYENIFKQYDLGERRIILKFVQNDI